jgi:hypothetical protein
MEKDEDEEERGGSNRGPLEVLSAATAEKYLSADGTALDVSMHRIRKIENFGGAMFSSIRELDLFANFITSLDRSVFSCLSSLTVLNLGMKFS